MLENFIYAKTKDLFIKELEAGNVADEAIVFIEDAKLIWNHGTYFDCSVASEIFNNYKDEVSNTYATKTSLDSKVDKVSGKQLSTEDFTTALKIRLEGINVYKHVFNDLSALPNSGDGWYSIINLGDTEAAIVHISSGQSDTQVAVSAGWGGNDKGALAVLNSTIDVNDNFARIKAVRIRRHKANDNDANGYLMLEAKLNRTGYGSSYRLTVVSVFTSAGHNPIVINSNATNVLQLNSSTSETLLQEFELLDKTIMAKAINVETITAANLATVATSGSYNDLQNKPSIASTTTNGLMSASDKSLLDTTSQNLQTEVARALKAENDLKQELSALIGESPETLDSIHEISAWITNDKSGAAAMAAQINENKTNLTKETERATEAEQILSNDIESSNSELVKRIQGTSDNSNAMKDPFKFVRNYNTATLGDFRVWLDSLHGTDYTLDNRGVYRVVLNDAVIEIISSPIEYTKERYNQVVKGRVSIESTTGLITSSAEFNLLERTHNIDNGWSSWRVVASADKLKDLYAKAIQIGSFEVEPLTDGIGVNFKNVDGTQGDSFEIPAATTESAGVMSAEDINELNDIRTVLGNTPQTITLTKEELLPIVWNGSQVVSSNRYNTWIVELHEGCTYNIVEKDGVATQRTCSEYPSLGKELSMTTLLENKFTATNEMKYLVLSVRLSDYQDSSCTIESTAFGLVTDFAAFQRLSTVDAEFVEGGYIVPKNGELPVTASDAYAYYLCDCIEGQKFVVSATASQNVCAWQFLNSENGIITNYEGGATAIVNEVVIAPEGAVKFLVNAKIDYIYGVKYLSSNALENVLSKEIKEVEGRIVNVEYECDNIKGIVGEQSSTIDLTTSDYSGLVYSGTSFVKASSSYDSFIFPLTQGNTYKIINNTDLLYNQAGISTIFTVSVTPALGEIGHARKLNFVDIELFTPQDDERYLVININKTLYTDNNFTYISESTGLFKRVEELEDNFSGPLQGKTILCLGDSITEFSYDGKRYSDYLAEITGANVINGGIGGAQMGRRMAIPSTAVFSRNAEAYACLDLPSIAYALNTGDFTMQEAAAQWLISDDNPNKTTDDNTAIVEVLQSVNLNSVDIVTIFIGTNDIGQYLGEIGESGDNTSYLKISQGFYEIIKNLLTKNPNLRIYYFSPMPRYWGDIRTFDSGSADADSNWCDNYTVSAGYSFPDLVDHLISLARYYKIPVCDMYRTLGINQWNIASIMRGDISDGTHPYKGFKMIANKIASFIIANNNLNI